MSAEPTQNTSRRLTHMEAIIEAIADAMRADPRVFYIGQDVGAMGGSMQGTKGLVEEFGPKRIREAPISESAMVGAALGAALFGQRPIVEVSFGEFLPAAMNQLINQAPNLHYMTGGTARVPVVVRTRAGDGPYGGPAPSRGRRPVRRTPAGLLRLVRPRAGVEGRHAGHAGGREGDDDRSDPRRG